MSDNSKANKPQS